VNRIAQHTFARSIDKQKARGGEGTRSGVRWGAGGEECQKPYNRSICMTSGGRNESGVLGPMGGSLAKERVPCKAGGNPRAFVYIGQAL